MFQSNRSVVADIALGSGASGSKSCDNISERQESIKSMIKSVYSDHMLSQLLEC